MRLRSVPERHEGPMAAAIILGLLAVVYSSNLGSWLVNDDEGSFLYQAWRMTEGEQPYRDFLSSRDPLFLYTGAAWMRLWGPDVVPMRALSTGATLVTGFLVYLLASRLASQKTALISMLTFLLHPHVVDNGRVFQPEPFYLLLVVLGLLLVEHGLQHSRTADFVLAGAIFGLAGLYKLLAFLSVGGCVLCFAILAIRREMSEHRLLIHSIGLLLPYTLVFGATTGAFVALVPGFAEGVIGIHFAQGSELLVWQVLLQGVAFFVVYSMQSIALLLASVPALSEARQNSRLLLIVCQLPTAAAFLVLSRGLLPRHLYYLLPSLVILVSISAESLLSVARGRLYHFVLIGLVVGPWLVTDAQLLSRSESDTLTIARYVASQTGSKDLIVSDYQELNFYALRGSTYHGAEVSYVTVDGGTINADVMVAQLESDSVQLLLIDVSEQTGHHLVAIDDLGALVAYLEDNFEHVRTMQRQGQSLAIYRRIAASLSD